MDWAPLRRAAKRAVLRGFAGVERPVTDHPSSLRGDDSSGFGASYDYRANAAEKGAHARSQAIVRFGELRTQSGLWSKMRPRFTYRPLPRRVIDAGKRRVHCAWMPQECLR
jgi:hypothetical protein